MAIKLGELFVQISARTSSFGKAMASMSESVDKVSKQVKQAAGDTAQLAGAITAAAGAAVLAASSRDKGIARELQRAKDAATALSVEIARLVLPALRESTAVVNKVVTLFRQMSPETKGMIADVLKWVAIIAAGSKGVQMLASGLGVVAAIAKAVGAILASGLIGPLLIAAAVAGVLIVVAGLIRQAWDDNLGGIREYAAAVWKWMGETAQAVFGFFRGGTSDLMGWWSDAFNWIIDQAVAWASRMLAVIKLIDFGLGGKFATEIDGIERGIVGLGEDLKKPGDFLARGAEFAAVKWDYTVKGIKKNFVSLGGLMDKYLGDLMPDSSMVPQASTADTSQRDAAIAKNSEATQSALDALDADVNARAVEFANIAKSQQQQLVASTAGFVSFDAALGEYQRAMGLYTQLMGEAKEQEIRGNEVAAQAAIEAAGKMKRLAEKSGKAADAFTQLEKMSKAEEEARKAAATASKQGLQQRIVSGMGKLGAIAQTASQGAQVGLQAGGPQGAVVGAALAAGAELMMQSEGFKEAIAASDVVIKALADALGQWMEPIAPLIAASGLIVTAIGDMLAPTMDLLAMQFESLTPVVFVIGTVLQQLAPIFGLLLQGFVMLVSNGVFLILPTVMGAFFEAVKWMGVGILKIVEWMSGFWNGVVNAISGFIQMVADFNIGTDDVVIKPFAGLGAYADSIKKTTIDQEELAKQIQKLEGLDWDMALAKAAELAATEEQTKATKEATGAITNAAKGWKYAFAAYAAMDPKGGGGGEGGGGGQAGVSSQSKKGKKGKSKTTEDYALPKKYAQSGTVYRPQMAIVGDGGEPEHIMGDSKFRQAIREEVGGGDGGGVVININGATNPEAVARAVMKVLEKLRFQRTGSFVQSSPRFAGG